jgi:hypothetical protein
VRLDHLLSMEILLLHRSVSVIQVANGNNNAHSLISFERITLKSYRKLRLVMMAKGNHAFPSRTRPLSPSAPMVLEPQGFERINFLSVKLVP